jgi:hypothetical protein
MNLLNFLFTLTRVPRRPWLSILPGLALFLLSACTPATFPIEITKITVEPKPLIGEVATVRFEFMSTENEPNTTLQIYLQDGVKLVSGNLLWQGSLNSNQVQAHEVSICTQFEGTWEVSAIVWSELATGGSYSDMDGVFLEVLSDVAHVISSNDYEPKSVPLPPEGSSRITPLPELTSPVCP